ncbi:ATP-binding cassette transporter [Coprinopsis cinerea AmutBmut pab1-1]|nr:ATP-binding cassette transporter [Coprinopsis cinerea AmutBmut pab1-1]
MDSVVVALVENLATFPFSRSASLRLAPSGLLGFHLLVTILCHAGWPLPLKNTWNAVSLPFRNFLTLDDLHDPVDLEPRDTTLQQRLLSLVSSIEAAVWAGCIGHAIYISNPEAILTSTAYLVSWVYIAVLTLARPPRTPPYLFIAFALSLACISLLDSAYRPLHGRDNFRSLASNACFLILHLCFVWVAGTLPIKTYRPGLNVAGKHDTPSSELTCPEDDVTLWTWSSFSFVEPIIKVASKRTLQESDVWNLSPFFLHKNIFAKCLKYRARHPNHSLLRFLIVSNSLDLIIDISLELVGAVIGFVSPYALQQILTALGQNDPQTRQKAFFWVMMTLFANLALASMKLFRGWHTRRCYERTRGQLFCAIHYKALKRVEISGHVTKEGDEESKAELGKITNLMRGDTYAIAQRFWDIAALFSAPVRFGIAVVFLYRVLGWSSLMAIVVVIMTALLNIPLGKFGISIHRASYKVMDKRMKLVNEFLQNIRFLKFYGWEYDWSDKTEKTREEELRWRVKTNLVSVVMSFIWTWMPSATALTCFLCYTIVAGEKLTVAKAFTSLALFSSIQGPLMSIPMQIWAMLYARVSMQRIEAFLSEDEVPDWASCFGQNVQPTSTKEIGFSDAVFEWEKRKESGIQPDGSNTSSAPRFQLGPLNVRFPAGALTIISGATGSGKSALLEALLGEMHCISGEVLIDKSDHQVAYCAQNPWLEHATIKENIVFGSPVPFDEERYHRVVHACALEPDLSILSAGDMTEIGEKGITLSGGQRARVALARALYSQAKVILLDDPLAAVDMHTARHIVDNCFTGELAHGRTMILVTHHISVCLPIASYLIELQKGQVLHQGTISELQAKNVLKTIVQAEEEPFPEAESSEGKDANSKAFGVSRLHIQRGKGTLVDEEFRAEGQVSRKTYLTYIRAAGYHCWAATIFLTLMIHFISVASQVFLARWGEAYQDKPAVHFLSIKLPKVKYPWDEFPPPEVDVKPWLLVYLYIGAAGAFTTVFSMIVGYYASLQASRALFIALLRRLTRAPLRFFDTTPVGRILNRFTNDMNTIDGALYHSGSSFIQGVLMFLVSFATILVIIPSFIPGALFIAWLYMRLAPGYVKTARDLRRLETVSLSPTFAGFDELLRGITHIRAFGMEDRYQNNFYKKVDRFQSYDHVYWLIQNWLSWRYECLSALVVASATTFALLQGVSNGSAAIVMVQAGIFASANRTLVSVMAQMELDFNSVERVVEYLEVPQEAPAINPDFRPPAYWPSTSGDLRVENLVVKYEEHLPAVLKEISFTINPGEKIGVVGRTGSGKSTLVLALLRMLEPTSGSIIIDGIDISKLGLEDLRTRLTVISQDVSLFSGTIRSNLDPLQKYTTEECQTVLDRCHLTSHFAHTPTTEESSLLDMAVNQNSMSAGEKQLLALARAILRGTNIIIMDEATSQIDMELDDKIQKTIREETAGAIVITIAHRLKTVIDYDRILVLDDGKVVEFDTPRELLSKSGGFFRNICRRSADWDSFSSLAGDVSGSGSCSGTE